MSRRLFNLNLNPYVTKIQQHADIIKTYHAEENPDTTNFINLSRPIIVDLGCGAGNFLRDYALSAPEVDFFGFELRYKRLVKGALKFKKRNLANVRLIQARAEDIALWFPPGSIREININFPDPWAKKKQLKHRLITPDFLTVLKGLLEEDGQFVFKTDHQDYFCLTKMLIEESALFEIIGYSEDLHNSSLNEQNIPTEFELLFKHKGYPVYYIKTKVR
ncbi:MAG: tRNA (guanosine(46)-N7)-methyltransferase TrmB [SAR324 cluster bacterium]|nr:tRNA (guanosine(46)-N7)-methyltransferase TrmB [SAR324 cluster bacterium]